MKSAEDLKSRLGGHMRESMGQYRPDKAETVPPPSFQADEKYQGVSRIRDAMFIDLDKIIPDPDQPRREFPEESIEELAESLRTKGQIQACEVRYDEAAKGWQIVGGERRYRAAIKAGLATLKVIEDKTPYDPRRVFIRQIVENLQREDLKPVEKARAFRKVMDDQGWDYRELAENLNVSTGSISRAMALLELPPDVQAGIDRGNISATAAAAVAKVADPEAREELVAKVASGQITADQAVAQARAERSRSKLEPTRNSKGRGGAKSKPAKLPTARAIRTSTGVRVSAEKGRGFDLVTLLTALREAAGVVEAEIESSRPVDPDQEAA